MRWLKIFSATCLFSVSSSISFSQTGESDLRVFGYFQNQFNYEKLSVPDKLETTFLLQQLNLFFQKDLATHWTSFVNFEILNTFSSFRQWGAFNLEEAWIRYRSCKEFSLKLGLQIPVFNNLNEIKNRTPLLPYIIRPLAYETSFNEFMEIEEFTPGRAFAQVYGFLPHKTLKLDYAVYIGNSPNITRWADYRQSSIDTTATVLVGGRIGIRFGELKAGFSTTRDNTNRFLGAKEYFDAPDESFEKITRLRLGADLSFNYKNISFESEYISVNYDDDIEEIEFDKKFYYGTLGCYMTERLFVYGSYWYTRETFTAVMKLDENSNTYTPIFGNLDIIVPNIGLAFNMNENITLKCQFARATIDGDKPAINEKQTFNYISLAVSAIF